MLADDSTLWIDEYECRPRVDPERLANLLQRIVHHRVFDPVPQYGLANCLKLAFAIELRPVHADDDQLVGELRLETLQIWNDMDAVDAALGPEVEQHNLAAQILRYRQRSLDVEPVDIQREVRNNWAWLIGEGAVPRSGCFGRTNRRVTVVFQISRRQVCDRCAWTLSAGVPSFRIRGATRGRNQCQCDKRKKNPHRAKQRHRSSVAGPSGLTRSASPTT